MNKILHKLFHKIIKMVLFLSFYSVDPHFMELLTSLSCFKTFSEQQLNMIIDLFTPLSFNQYE